MGPAAGAQGGPGVARQGWGCGGEGWQACRRPLAASLAPVGGAGCAAGAARPPAQASVIAAPGKIDGGAQRGSPCCLCSAPQCSSACCGATAPQSAPSACGHRSRLCTAPAGSRGGPSPTELPRRAPAPPAPPLTGAGNRATPDRTPQAWQAAASDPQSAPSPCGYRQAAAAGAMFWRVSPRSPGCPPLGPARLPALP